MTDVEHLFVIMLFYIPDRIERLVCDNTVLMDFSNT